MIRTTIVPTIGQAVAILINGLAAGAALLAVALLLLPFGLKSASLFYAGSGIVEGAEIVKRMHSDDLSSDFDACANAMPYEWLVERNRIKAEIAEERGTEPAIVPLEPRADYEARFAAEGCAEALEGEQVP